MKILYFITGLRLGGAEKQLLLLAKNMQEAKHEVIIVAMEANGVMIQEFKRESIKVLELGIKNVKTLWPGYKKFKNIVQQFSPDIIHSHMIHANLFARAFKLFNRKIKLISTAHNIKEGGKIMMNGYALTRSIANWSTNVSEEAFNFFISNSYFEANKSSYIPNAIDTDKFDPDLYHSRLIRNELGIANDAYIYFSAGRLHEQKNHQLLINAFNKVQKVIPETVLVIAGEGPLVDELTLLSIELGIRNKIYFLGRRNDMPALMSMCNCFVISSNYEGFGLVVGEAMAMKKAVIATDCGGVKEVMGNYGLLINTNDVDALANAMIEIYKSPFESSYLDAARKHIEDNYSVIKVMNKWIKLYGEVC